MLSVTSARKSDTTCSSESKDGAKMVAGRVDTKPAEAIP